MQLSTVQGADTLNSKAQPCQRSPDMLVYMAPHVYILERVHQTGQLLQSKQEMSWPLTSLSLSQTSSNKKHSVSQGPPFALLPELLGEVGKFPRKVKLDGSAYLL